MEPVVIDGKGLRIEDVVAVAVEDAPVEVSSEAVERVAEAAATVERFVREGRLIYGVTTGYGALSSIPVPRGKAEILQRNLILSHSAGTGPGASREVVRATMLLRANTLVRGNSGVRPSTVDRLLSMLNVKVHPIIPEVGSVGASGDLAQLAHVVLAMIGEGTAEYQGEVLPAREALMLGGVGQEELTYKEGVALINGTAYMTGIGALAVFRAERALRTAEVAAAMSFEALRGIRDAFEREVHWARPHPGQGESANNLRRLVHRSELVLSGPEAEEGGMKVQDAYSLRCAPQVLGAVRDALAYARRVVEIEMNSSVDNPLLFPEAGKCLSGGNFHGQPVALAMDLLGLSMCSVSNIAERRVARLLDAKRSEGLPAFLVHPGVERGLHNGLMLTQYTAAALASECKVLAHPSSVDTIPTSAGQEDHVSMGASAARNALRIVEKVEGVVGIELLCAAQALDLRLMERALRLGDGTAAAHRAIREKIPVLKEDRALYRDIRAATDLVRGGVAVKAVEDAVGALA